MTQKQEKEIIEKIKEIIIDVYESIYIGDMKIVEEMGGYTLSLYMNKDFLTPTYKLYHQGVTIDEFLDCVREDLLLRDLDTVRYFTGEKINLNEYKKGYRREGKENQENKQYDFGACL